MNQSHRSFTGSIPENYRRYLVPLIFEDYAVELAARLDVTPGGAVLETACGTGVVTRHLLASLADGARLTSSDLNPDMIAEARLALRDTPALTFQEADATALPFDDGVFDAVVCQFGVMFFPDKAKGYAEAARVLKPGGQFLFSVWDSLERNRLAQVVHRAVGALFPDDPPNFLELPYGYQDLTAILRALQGAGFADVEMTVRPRQSQAPDARHVALAICTGSPLANQLADRSEPNQDFVIESVTSVVEAEFGAGPLEAPMQAIQISARKAE